MDIIKDFKCVPIKCLFHSDNFKIYATELSSSKEKIMENKYGNISIVGNFHDLTIGIEYTIKAKEEIGKYGVQYNVKNIKRDKPTTKTETFKFLKEILTIRQAESLLNAYPNIINMIIEDNVQTLDFSKTPYIKQYTFDLIKNKIVENFHLMELVSDFKNYLSFSILKNLYDKYSSVEKIKIELSNNPYKCLCGLNRVAFKTADNILLKLEEDFNKSKLKGEEIPIEFVENLKSSQYRLFSYVEFVLKSNESNGNTNMKIKDLMLDCNKNVKDCIKHLKKILESKEFKIINDKISLLSTFEKEKYIFEKLFLSNNISNIWNIDNLDKYKNKDGFIATNKQFSILDIICKNQISVLCGYSGSGKSTSAQMVIDMLLDNNKTFRIFAPTGKASKVIAKYTKQKASTVHVGLEYNPNVGWMYNEDNKLIIDFLIIDEFSMTDLSLCYNLFKALDFNRTKILIIGDPEQLPSVGCGNILHDIIDNEIVPIVMLDEIFRYGVGGITTVATKIRNSEPFLPKTDKPITIGEDKGYTFIPSNNSEDIIKKLMWLYSKLLEKYKSEEIMVLSPFNKGNAGSDIINKNIHKLANENCGNDNNYIQYGNNKYYIGDLLLQCVNNYNAKKYYGLDKDDTCFISNGDVGKISEIDNNNVIINFDGETIIYEKQDFENIKLSYSMSVHKSQGSQAKVVVFVSDKSHIIMLDSNLMYVAITRAEHKCFHIGNVDVVNKAVKKKSTKRNTNTEFILKNLKC